VHIAKGKAYTVHGHAYVRLDILPDAAYFFRQHRTSVAKPTTAATTTVHYDD
jgi:hypothetical protein